MVQAKSGRHRAALSGLLLACSMLGGCYHLDPSNLDADQLGYSQAMGEADKRQTLLNVIRLRYGDSPTFLQATQVISGYQLQKNVSGGFELFPAASASTFLDGSATAQLQESPTFTFQPMTGQQFAQSFIRPLPPADLLSFAISGLPIDVLFRLGVQSVNNLDNATGLTDVNATGSADFFLLLHDLRQLQVSGLLGVTLQHAPEMEKDKAQNDPGRIYLSLGTPDDPALASVVTEAKRLLGIPKSGRQVEVVYGRVAGKGQVAVLTRSILGALQQLAIQSEVPEEDVAQRRTLATVGNIGIEQRPVVMIHSGAAAPADAFAVVAYQGTNFWIANDDFDSKLAYTVLQLLIAVAKTGSAPGTVITIPAG
jgi:hypothetical protein